MKKKKSTEERKLQKRIAEKLKRDPAKTLRERRTQRKKWKALSQKYRLKKKLEVVTPGPSNRHTLSYQSLSGEKRQKEYLKHLSLEIRRLKRKMGRLESQMEILQKALNREIEDRAKMATKSMSPRTNLKQNDLKAVSKKL